MDSEKSITFNIPDDAIALEPPEKFTLTLTVVTSGDGIMLQPNDKTDITILDEDGKFSPFIIAKRINILPKVGQPSLIFLVAFVVISA